MCGIVGIVSGYKNGLAYNEMDAFEQLLFMDTVRGYDSTGVFTVHNRHVDIIKQAVMAPVFLVTEAWKAHKTEATRTGAMIVGHNRKATQGSISSKNAHPFVKENIILVHNGSINDHKSMAETEVDSEAICHHLAAEGVAKTVESISSKGAFTLVWYDVTKGRLHLIRNEQRPMSVCTLETGGFAFASEGIMLAYALSRTNLKYKDLHEIDPYKLVTLSQTSKTEEDLSKLKKYPVVIHNYHTHRNVPGHQRHHHQAANPETSGATGGTATTPTAAILQRSNSRTRVLLLDGENYADVTPPAKGGLYTMENTVVFQPMNWIKKDPSRLADRNKVEGMVYLPNEVEVKALWYVPEAFGDESIQDMLTSPGFFRCTVVNVGKIQSTKEDMVWVKDVVDDSYYQDARKEKISQLEVAYLERNALCANNNCNAEIKAKEVHKSIFIREGTMLGQIHCICPECVKKLEEEANNGKTEKPVTDLIAFLESPISDCEVYC